MLEETDITVLVLCGGAATRMGGVDKPLQLIAKAGVTLTMLDHVIATLSTHSPLIISANRSIAKYQRRGPVVTDGPEVGSGPLLGILAGLKHAQTEWLLVCPGDMRFLRQGWQEPIRQAVKQNPKKDPVQGNEQTGEQGGKKTRQLDSAVIHDGTRLQPLLCLVRTSCAESLQVYLQAGGVSVHRWLATLHCAIVSHNNTGQFLNINTLAELHDSRA